MGVGIFLSAGTVSIAVVVVTPELKIGFSKHLFRLVAFPASFVYFGLLIKFRGQQHDCIEGSIVKGG